MSRSVINAAGFAVRIARFVFVLGCVCSASGQLNHVPVVSTGVDIPGAPRGQRIEELSDLPVMADSGKMMYVAALAGMGVSPATNLGVFRMGLEAGLRPAMVTRSGIRASGLPGGTVVSAVGAASVNATGASVYVATISGPGVGVLNNTALMISDAASTRTIVRRGARAPAMNFGITIADISCPQIASSGHVAFEATFAGTGMQPGSNKALYIMAPGGTISLALRQGGQVAGMAIGVLWADFGNPTLGPGGQLLILGFLDGTNVTPLNYAVIWSSSRGIIARKGDAISGTGLTMGDFSEPSLSGATAGFIATLDAPNSTEIQSGVFLSSGAGPATLIARSGQADAALDSNTTWLLFGQPALAARGGIAFLATLTGSGAAPTSTDAGLWAGDSSGIAQVARTGAAVPGAPGVLFDAIDQPCISASGHIVFTARLRGTGVTADNNSAILSYHANTGLIVVARTGRPVALGGISKTPTALQTAVGGDNRPTSLTRLGSLVYLLRDARGATVVRTTLPTSISDVASAAGAGPDGVIDGNDLAAFLAAFAAGSLAADVAGTTGPQRDGVVTQDDMDAFMVAYNARRFAGVR